MSTQHAGDYPQCTCGRAYAGPIPICQLHGAPQPWSPPMYQPTRALTLHELLKRIEALEARLASRIDPDRADWKVGGTDPD